MKKMILFLFFSSLLHGEIVQISPENGVTLSLLPENQRQLLMLPSHSARVKKLAADRARGPKYGFHDPALVWREAVTLSFSWKCTGKEKGAFAVLVSETPDFKKYKTVFAKKSPAPGVPYLLNLKPGTKYWWKVSDARGRSSSKAGFFFTEDRPPRWIALENIKNIRDLGGYKTCSGKKVRYGMLFRGQRLNENSTDHRHPGRSRLTVEDLKVLTCELGIRTDLDIRSKLETAGMKESPLGGKVIFLQRTGPSYSRIFKPFGKKFMADIFRVLCRKENYPIYFHCSGGADRTGAVALVANGLLGVSENDLCADWGHTFFPRLPDNMSERIRKNFNFPATVRGFDRYGKKGDPLHKKIENYLLSCGITPKEIADFKKIMLEP